MHLIEDDRDRSPHSTFPEPRPSAVERQKAHKPPASHQLMPLQPILSQIVVRMEELESKLPHRKGKGLTPSAA